MDIDKLIEKIPAALKSLSKYSIPIGLASAAILFIPDGLLRSVGISEIDKSVRIAALVVFVLAVCFLLYGIASFSWDIAKKRRVASALKRRRFSYLHQMNARERELITKAFHHSANTVDVFYTDASVFILSQRRILLRTLSAPDYNGNMPYRLDPECYEYLKKHGDLLIT
jgi:hypothetical protein